MHDLTRRALLWMSAVLALWPSGRHRAVPNLPAPHPGPARRMAWVVDSPSIPHRPVPPRLNTDSPTLEPRTVPLPLDGGLPALVRPYIAAHERRQRPKNGSRVGSVREPSGMAVIR